MSDELVKIPEVVSTPIVFDLTKAKIAELSAAFMPLKVTGVDDKAGLVAVHEARMEIKGYRVAIEKKRKEYKAEALEYGKRVDSAAKSITDLLEPIEAHLQREETLVEDAKAKLKADVELAKKRKLDDRMAKIWSLKMQAAPSDIEAMSDEDFETKLAAAQKRFDEAEAERVRAEAEAAETKRKDDLRRQAEEDAFNAERKELQRQRDDDRRKREKADAEAEAERLRLKKIADDLAEQEREAKRQKQLEEARAASEEKGRKDAEAKAARDADEAKRKKAEAEAKAARREARKPAVVKLREFASVVESLKLPDVGEEAAEKLVVILSNASQCIRIIAEEWES